MTKRTVQPGTVAVPAANTVAAVPAIAAVAAAATPEMIATDAVVADEDGVIEMVAPVRAVAQTAPQTGGAAMEPAPMADPAQTADPAMSQSSTTETTTDGTEGDLDYTPYIIGGVLLAGGVLALALSGGDDDDEDVVAPPPPPPPPPANAVPVFAAGTTGTVAENAAVSTVVFDANATGPETGQAIVYTIGGTDAALFTIDAATGEVRLRASANFEATPTKTSYSFTVTATDNGTPAASATQTITVTLTNVNEAPAFATATATVAVAENVAASTVVYDAEATDVDAGQLLTYTLTGADAALFAITAATGEVRFIASPDFETRASYSFNVVATDGATPGLTATQAVTVNVTDVNENPAPVFTSGATATVAENAAIATVVYDANATDTNTVTFSLTGADAAAFAIDTATGVVTLRAGADFETKATYNINVVATDNGTPTASTTQAVVVTVTNVNEAPTFATPTVTATVAENIAVSTVVFDAAATDVDAGTTLAYTLTGTDAASFTIDTATGEVRFIASPDFEVKNSYSFNVVASDGANPALTASQAVTLTVSDVADLVNLDGGPIPATTVVNFDAATGNVAFGENAAEGNLSLIANFTAGDTIVTDVATGRYSFTSIGTDLVITLNNGGVVTQITLDDAVGLDDFISNEATAERAIGFDFFRTSAAPPPPASNSLDSGTLVFDATTAANTYNESAASTNNVTINGFTSDDRIVVSGRSGAAANTAYSFTSLGDDLIITFNNNGVASRIVIADVVSPNAFVSNEQNAEIAVGFDFFSYA